MAWFESPQYLKALRKIQSFGPEDRAVTQTLVDALAANYAGREFGNQLRDMRSAMAQKERMRSLDLQKQRIDLSKELGEGRLGIAKDIYDTQRRENTTAETLGWINMPLSGLAGLAELKRKRNAEASLYEFAKRYK